MSLAAFDVLHVQNERLQIDVCRTLDDSYKCWISGVVDYGEPEVTTADLEWLRDVGIPQALEAMTKD